LETVDAVLARRIRLLARATTLLTVLVADDRGVRDWTFATDGFSALGVRRTNEDLELGEPTSMDELEATLMDDLGPGDGGSVLATGVLLGQLRRALVTSSDAADGSSELEPHGNDRYQSHVAVPDCFIEAGLLEPRPNGDAVLTPAAARILPAAVAPSWMAIIRRDLDPPCQTEQPSAEVRFVGPPGHRITALDTEDRDVILLADESLELKRARVLAICAPWVYELPCRLVHGDANRVIEALQAGLRNAGTSVAGITRREIQLSELLDAPSGDAAIALLRSAPLAFRLASRDWQGRIVNRCAGAADATRTVLYQSRRIDGGELLETDSACFKSLLAAGLDLPLDDDVDEADAFLVVASALAAATLDDVSEVAGLPASVAAAMSDGWRWGSAEVSWRPSLTGRASESVTWIAAPGHLWMLAAVDENMVCGRPVTGQSLVERLLAQ
jgi:hypothetical protein